MCMHTCMHTRSCILLHFILNFHRGILYSHFRTFACQKSTGIKSFESSWTKCYKNLIMIEFEQTSRYMSTRGTTQDMRSPGTGHAPVTKACLQWTTGCAQLSLTPANRKEKSQMLDVSRHVLDMSTLTCARMLCVA
jgi:hypothetical protein